MPFYRALLSLVVVVSSSDTSPMTKIVTLLDDLENQLEEQGTKEGALYNEFNSWCDSEAQESTTTISDADAKVADLGAFLEEQEAFRKRMTSEVNELVQEVASNEEDLKQATEIRQKEHQQYLQNEQAFVGSIDEVNRALEVLSADSPGGSTKSLVEIQQAVRHCLERTNLPLNRAQQSTLDSFFRSTMQSGVQSFLQIGEPFKSTLSPLVQLLEGIRSDTETNRNSATKEEQQSENAFQLMQQSLESEIEAGGKALDGKKSQIAQSSERSAVKDVERVETQRISVETNKYLQGVYAQCKQKAREWKDRTKLRSDELTAIREAKKILTSEAAKRIQSNNPTAFIQTRKTLQTARRHLKKFPGLALLATATTVTLGSQNPFSGVRKMIEEMIERLLNAAAEETEKKQWCDQEMKKSMLQKTSKEKDIDKLNSRIDEMDATLAELKDELAQLSKDLSEMNAMTAEATNVRTQERTQSQLAIKEYSEAQNLLQNAMTVLKDFYAQKDAFLQSVQWQGDYGAPDDKAQGVIGLLEIAMSDFQRLQNEAETSESTAEREYQDLMNESKIRKAVFTKNVEYKSDEKVKLESALARAKADRQGYQNELGAVKEYLEKLTPECTVKVESFEDRTERRKRQIESLQEALQIINGEAIG